MEKWTDYDPHPATYDNLNSGKAFTLESCLTTKAYLASKSPTIVIVFLACVSAVGLEVADRPSVRPSVNPSSVRRRTRERDADGSGGGAATGAATGVDAMR